MARVRRILVLGVIVALLVTLPSVIDAGPAYGRSVVGVHAVQEDGVPLHPKLGDGVGGVVQRCCEVVVRARIVGVDDPVLDVPRGVVAPAEPAQPGLPVLLGADSREADDGVSLRVREGRLGAQVQALVEGCRDVERSTAR